MARFSIMEIQSKKYLQESGKTFLVDTKENRTIFFNENDAENALSYANAELSGCFTLIDENAETRTNIKSIMRDRLDYRGYTVTDEKLEQLLDIYEDCQEWDDDENMLTGTTYDEIDEFVKRNYAVDEIFGET